MAVSLGSSPARASTLDQNQSGVFPFINFCCSLLNLKVYMRLEGAATGGVVLAYSLLNMKIFVGQRYHHYSFHIGITPACGATTCAVAFYNFLCVR
ncbi:uncharacterized protein [Elaeis guineensis]|uniref:uncharacterized protein isoform X8 n=1 Tax=Elaeis guineensis var. tenera TaxID=51953 RepID=UPI003C6DAFF7